MNSRFVLTAVATAALNLVLHALLYAAFLKDFFAAHPAGSADFLKQLHKGIAQMAVWSLLLSALSLGLLIALVMRWSGARTFGAGLRSGLALGGLYWSGINFGLYASSNLFSLPSTLVDLVCSAACMTLSAGFAAWLLGRGREASPQHGARSEPLLVQRSQPEVSARR